MSNSKIAFAGNNEMKTPLMTFLQLHQYNLPLLAILYTGDCSNRSVFSLHWRPTRE